MQASSGRSGRVAALAVLVLAVTAAPVVGQGGGSASHAAAPVARATALQGAITLDGRLSESGWASATPVTTFTQLDPNEGQPVSERTEVYVLYDDEALYIG